MDPHKFDEFERHMTEYHEIKNWDPERTILLGDQLTSDIYFGNKNKMKTVWVHNWNRIDNYVADQD